MATLLIAGATGRTGRPLVERLLKLGHKVRVIVRSPEKLPQAVLSHPNIRVIQSPILDLSDEQMSEAVDGCDGVVSCLGHVLDFKGIFGDPKNLCTDAARRLCTAIESTQPASPTRFILMNTVGVPNPERRESRKWHERLTLKLLRWFLPPHRDNENAVEHLRACVGTKSPYVEWCIVRPDSLIEEEESQYEIAESPVTGIFSGRPTARTNVAKFMSHLLEEQSLWLRWKFKMPVVMNSLK